MTDPFSEFVQGDDPFAGFAEDALDAYSTKNLNPSNDLGVGGYREPQGPVQNTMGQRLMNIPLSPAARLVNKLGLRVPDPSLANVYQGAKEGLSNAVNAAFGPSASGVQLSPQESPALAELLRTSDPRRRAELKAQVDMDMKNKAESANRQWSSSMAADRANYEKTYPTDVAGEFIGRTIPDIAVSTMMPGARIQKGAGTAERYLQNMLNSAYTSAALTPGSAGERAKSAGTSALLSPLMQAGIEKGVLPAARVAKSVATAKIPVDYGKAGETLREAASDVSDDLFILDKIAAKDPFMKSKTEAIKRGLENNIDNPAERIRLSAQVRELGEKTDRNSLYKARNLMADTMKVKVDKAPIATALANAMDEAEQAQDTKTYNYLKTLYERVNSKKGDKFHISDDFLSIDTLRSMLGDEIRAGYKGDNSITGPKAAGILQKVKDAVSEGMSRASQGPSGNGVVTAQTRSAYDLLSQIDARAREAHQAYKDKWSDPLATFIHGESPLQTGVQRYSDTAPDEILGKFAFKGEGHGLDMSQKAIKARMTQTPQGERVVKSMLFDAALKKSKGNPQEFLNAVESPGVRAFFDKEDLELLEGFKKIMAASEKAGKTSAAGAGALVGTVAGGYFGHPVLGAVGGTGIGMTGGNVRGVRIPERVASKAWTKLFKSPTGQKILFDANKLSVDSPEMQALLASIPGVVSTGENKLKALLGGEE